MSKTEWDFKKHDVIQQCGGLHVAGNGEGGAFAVMPVAFYKGELVDKIHPTEPSIT